MNDFKDQYEALAFNKKVLIRHCEKFQTQCLAQQKIQCSCKLQTFIHRKKLFQIRTSFSQLARQLLFLDPHTFKTMNDCLNYVDKIVLKMEKLEIDLAKFQGTEHVQQVKKAKILALCHHINLSMEEAKFMHKVWDTLEHYIKQLEKRKRKVYRVFQKKTNWIKPYLKQVKRYKKTSRAVSNVALIYLRNDYL
jgi:hypothetical protein